jgi:hypothetical protein
MSNENGFASLDDLFAAPPRRRFTTVVLPISGHKLRIRSLTERELSAYQTTTVAASGGPRRERLNDAARRMIVLCVVDTDGNRLMTDQHIAKLADWDAADTNHLYQECAKHVGVSQVDVEDLVKNSEAITVASS